MPDFLPSFSSAMVFGVNTAGENPAPGGFTGSCGAFTSRNVFLTAAHCAPDNQQLIVVAPIEGNIPRIVHDRSYHPTSDLALLLATPCANPDSAQALSNQLYRLAENPVLEDGGEFICAGYPAGSTFEGEAVDQPVSRVLRGNFQRWFNHHDSSGRTYFAFEMSCPAPAGLSGSVVAYRSAPDVAAAVVTANLDSYALVDRLEEVERNGQVYREQISRVVSYGIAAALNGKQHWINETLSAWEEHL